MLSIIPVFEEGEEDKKKEPHRKKKILGKLAVGGAVVATGGIHAALNAEKLMRKWNERQNA